MDFSAHHRLLPGMKPRPKITLCDKKNTNEVIMSENIATFVFLKNCENYELKIEGKAAKIMCENCKCIKVEVEKPLVSGTFELLRTHNAQIKILKECEIPIIQIDDSDTIDIEICNKDQLKSIYFQRTKGIKVHMHCDAEKKDEAKQDEEFAIDTTLTVELQNVDEIPQWVAHWNKNMVKFVSERVARSGIYPSQKQMKAEDKETS